MQRTLADNWLMAVPTETDRTMAAQGRITPWWTLHNGAVIDFRKVRVGAMAPTLTDAEFGLLSLAWGIEMFAAGMAEARDPFSGEHFHAMVRGLVELLNYEHGRISRGVVAAWAEEMCQRWGVDYDTGEWIGSRIGQGARLMHNGHLGTVSNLTDEGVSITWDACPDSTCGQQGTVTYPLALVHSWVGA